MLPQAKAAFVKALNLQSAIRKEDADVHTIRCRFDGKHKAQ
jgi:hypothetical protein